MASEKQRSIVESYYTRIRGNRCAYCGVVATQAEHIIPASVMFNMIELGVAEHSLIVPSCAECNGLASDSIQRTFIARREFIRNKLRTKYSRLLSLKYELCELIHEQDELVIQKFNELRLQYELEHRITHEHSYTFTSDAPEQKAKRSSEFAYDCPKCKRQVPYTHRQSYELAVERKQPCSKCVGHEVYCAEIAAHTCTCECRHCGTNPKHKHFLTCNDWHKRKSYACTKCARKLRAKDSVANT